MSKKHNDTNTNNDININNGVINKNHNNIIIVTANFLGDFLWSNLSFIIKIIIIKTKIDEEKIAKKNCGKCETPIWMRFEEVHSPWIPTYLANRGFSLYLPDGLSSGRYS